MTFAACDGVATDIFFPDLDEVPAADASFLCQRCPVRPDCLQHAITNDEEGYWGGTTKAQREAIMSGRSRVKCPSCGSRDIVELGQTICIGCGLSW
jgi:Zn finger protein HypA/HybF involved in hydrogenase expression